MSSPEYSLSPPLSLLYSSNECKLVFPKDRTCDVSSGSLPVSAADVDDMISDAHLNAVQKPFKCYTLQAMFAFVGSCVHLLQEF